MLLNEVLTLKVLFICKNLLNINDKTVIYQLLECVLSIVLNTSLQKIIQMIFRISFEPNRGEQKLRPLLEISLSVENKISI